MSDPNFEAIGRYQHASGQVFDHLSKRSELLRKLNKSCERSCGNDTSYIQDFDPDAAQSLLDQIRESHTQMLGAIAEANLWAKDANAAEFRITKPAAY